MGIKTKYGTALKDKSGYYMICSKKEGNYSKLLHRAIWEEWYGKSVPKGYDIHHINEDKSDNRIQNLQCVEHNIHMSFHKRGVKNPMYGKTPLLDTRLKLSRSTSESGYFRVTKNHDKKYTNGYYYSYRWRENGKQKKLASVSLKELERKVKAHGLEWNKL